jgi:phosphate transport system permease protein
MIRRKLEENFFRILMVLATIVVAGSFFLIVGTIVYKGVPFMNWDMVTKIPGGGFYIGKEGGVVNAIIGSLYVAGGATILGLLISIPVAIYINMYLAGRNIIANGLRIVFDVLFGIPSIVYGAFGFLIMVYLVIPILVRTLDEVIRTVPRDLRNASLALGATRWEMSKVIIRQIRPGVFTAILLSFGRAIGDVASVLFTAGFSDNIPNSLHQPAATLPVAIFFQLGSPVAEVQGRAYASALLLTIIVLIITILSSVLAKRFSKNNIQ